MLFVLDERLKSQSASADRFLALLADIIDGLFEKAWVEDMFTPKSLPPARSVYATFAQFADSSMMTLSSSRYRVCPYIYVVDYVSFREQLCSLHTVVWQTQALPTPYVAFSMERLFDLMCGGVKLMACTVNSAEELVTGTVAHLNGVAKLLREIPTSSKSCEQRRTAALQLVEASKCKVMATYYTESWTPAHVSMLRSELLAFFIDFQVKVYHQAAATTVLPSIAA